MTTEPLTADTITDAQIRALREEAIDAWDHEMHEICSIALGDEIIDESNGRHYVPTSTEQMEAREACAAAIDGEEAQS